MLQRGNVGLEGIITLVTEWGVQQLLSVVVDATASSRDQPVFLSTDLPNCHGLGSS